MILIAISLFISTLIPIILGHQLLMKTSFPFIHKHILSICISYGLGLGIISLWMLILGICRIGFSLPSIGFPLFLLYAYSFLLAPTKTKGPLSTNKKSVLPAKNIYCYFRNTPAHILATTTLMTLFIAYNIIFVYWRALNIPVENWDVLSFIAFKAKIFFYKESLYLPHRLPHSSYPLFVPLSLTWIALNLGFWSETLVKVFFPMVFLVFTYIIYFFLKQHTTKTWSLLGICILLSSNLFVWHGTIGYRDLTMSYFNCTAILLILLYCRTTSLGLLITAGMFSGLTTFTKFEGTGYLLIHTLLIVFVLLYQKKQKLKEAAKSFFYFFTPAAAILALFTILKITSHVSMSNNRLVAAVSTNMFARIPIIFEQYANFLFLKGSWNIVWVLFAVSLLNIKRIREHFETRCLLTMLATYFGLYSLVGLLTPEFYYTFGNGADTTLSRLILHFYPLACIAIIFLNCPLLKKDSQ